MRGLDKALFFLMFVLLGLIRPDMLVIMGYLILFPYLYWTGRKKYLKPLLISSVLAVLWMVIAKNQYNYNTKMMQIQGVSLFPLFAWALGLFIFYLIASSSFSGVSRRWIRVLLILTMYWVMLIFIESIAYHVFHIQNAGAAMYSGLPVCDCIHAPAWMQIVYLGMGPVYLLLMYFGSRIYSWFRMNQKDFSVAEK